MTQHPRSPGYPRQAPSSPEAVKSLEEVGFPIVLFERLGLQVSDTTTVEAALSRAMRAAQTRSDLTPIEREMVSDAQSVRSIRN
jgi:hypothetical protein